MDEKMGTGWVIDISKDSNVPMRSFLQLREKYVKQNEDLEKVIKNESRIQEENSELKIKMRELQTQADKYLAEANKWGDQNRITSLNGEWECVTSLDNNPTVERFRFWDGTIRVYKSISGRDTFEEFRYNHFSYNPTTKKISLDIQPSDGKAKWYYLLEDKGDDFKELEGTVYKMSTVETSDAYHYNSYPVFSENSRIC
jgi:hypothetical protein